MHSTAIAGNAQSTISREYADLRLTSAFQPIFSFTNSRPIGYEALVRATDPGGKSVSPVALFERAARTRTTQTLDRACLELHCETFAATVRSPSWLFLNVSPEALEREDFDVNAYRRIFAEHGILPGHVVIEILEGAISDEDAVARRVEAFRALGCLIALDDFGRGHSNFSRAWRLRPDVVKLDGEVMRNASDDRRVALTLSRMTSLLHEAGALVLAEGVELEYHAFLALDADIDLVQGYYFGVPDAKLARVSAVNFEGLYNRFREVVEAEADRFHLTLAPYVGAIEEAVSGMEAGQSFEQAAKLFMKLPLADGCYLLNEAGIEIEHAASRLYVLNKFSPLADSRTNYWGRRPYFRRALRSPRQVQLTRPYLSVRSGLRCVTCAVAFKYDGRALVFCGDIRWEAALQLALLSPPVEA
ncbi:MAG TPA: EAL domain-containing protein [Burkholderiales bacterium]|nr:EAL domain-containing protein [Burkholderiales bacterium]